MGARVGPALAGGRLGSDLAYLLFLEELLGPEWVERWARERGKLDALREWREVARGDLPQSREPPKEKRASPPWTSPHLFPNLFPSAAIADVENAVSLCIA